MLENIPKYPEIPEHLYIAAGQKRLVPFIGAGVSKLAGYPDWDELANEALKYFVTKGILNHAQFNIIKNLPQKTKLTFAINLEKATPDAHIDFKKILSRKDKYRSKDDIYAQIFKLFRFSQTFVTTNFDTELDKKPPAVSWMMNGEDASISEPQQLPTPIYKPNEIDVSSLDKKNTVIHVHGSIHDQDSMVLTTSDYLTRYYGHRFEGTEKGENRFLTFLQQLFKSRNVLFIGYGLEELEILEYVIPKGSDKQLATDNEEPRHYVLMGFFSYQLHIANTMKSYFKSLGISLLPYSRDEQDWDSLIDVINYLNETLPRGKQLVLTERLDMANLLPISITTTAFTSNEAEFINRMTLDMKRATWGFKLLSERLPTELDRYFNLLNENGLLMPDSNQEIIPSGPALKYLEAVAIISDKSNKPELAGKIMDIVRTVSTKGEFEIRKSTNRYASYLFAKIIGAVPISAVDMEDIELLPIWLDNELDNGGTAREISEGILSRTLNENTADSLKMACRILYHCTDVKWVSEYGMNDKYLRPVTVIKDYWLGELLKRHIPDFGEKAANETAKILIDRLKEISYPEKTKKPSSYSNVIRPAIEKHVQNRRHAGPFDHFVEGLRDVLSLWIKRDPELACDFVKELMNDEAGIIRRIVIHALNQHWSVLKEMYLSMLSVELFQPEYLHEMYELLSARFAEMTDERKGATLDVIRNLSTPDYIEEEVRGQWLKSKQLQWLSAIANKGDDSVDKWYAELNADKSISKVPSHPDFSYYSESGFLPDTSPYTVQEILYFDEQGTLVDKLNEFKETNNWKGPTKYGLTNTLAETVKENPKVFINAITDFISADYPYQYGIINGFKQLWDTNKENQAKDIDWDAAWEKLIGFFEIILTDEDIWQKTEGEDIHRTPTRNWIPPIIAEFLNAGTRADNHSYPATLLSRARKLIILMLEKIDPETDAGEDAINQAINSAKGKVIEALFNHTLRECRVNDKEAEEHHTIWAELRPIFDKELDKCRGTNFEFSALAGNYLIYLDYISHEWLQENFQRIFSKEYSENFLCAMNGLVYAQMSQPVYSMLADTDILDRALRTELKGIHTREGLLERIALAYLWESEILNGPRFTYLFELACLDDLENISNFFHSVDSRDLKPEQVDRIIAFFNHAIDWSQSLDETPAKLLSSLSMIICHLKPLDNDDLKRLIFVTPYIGYNANTFLEELERLAENHMADVCEIFRKLADTYHPSYDYQDRLQLFIKKIAKYSPQMRYVAIQYVDELAKKGMPGMMELHHELTS